jgi:DNA-binding HxlR family transcriptional regulator
MSDQDHAERILSLLALRESYEVLDALHSRGAARFAELQANSNFRSPVSVLRSLAAEGLIVCTDGGSMDDMPNSDTVFDITDQGRAIFDHLVRLRAWIATRSPADQARPHHGNRSK